MGGNDEANIDMMRRIQSSFGNFSSSVSNQTMSMNQQDTTNSNTSQMCNPMRHFGQGFSVDNGKRSGGIPPSYPNHTRPVPPYSLIPVSRNATQQLGSHGLSQGPSHSRSLSQSSFFSFDSLPPLSPSPYRGESPSTSTSDQGLADVSMEERDTSSQSLLPPSPYTRGNAPKVGESLPPRKSHRRSNSDISFGFPSAVNYSPPFLPLRGNTGAMDQKNPGSTELDQFVKKEITCDSNSDGGELADDLFSAYMNLDNLDTLNSSGTDEKHGNASREDLDSRASGTKTNDSSENEAESRVNAFAEKREGVKRSAGSDIAPTTRHYRSISMDSFMDNMHFDDESSKFPPIRTCSVKQSPSNSMDGNVNAFSMEFGNGEFTGPELKKIMANDKLAEIALSDPKRVKRILANRQSAARSKERKVRYISELEHKVQTLQTEATTLSAQLTLLQRDATGLTSQNNELKFRLRAMEQQGQLRDALNETLTAEVQRLKLAANAHCGESHSKCRSAQLTKNPQAFKMAQRQTDQLNLHQMQLQDMQQQLPPPPPPQQNSSATKDDSNH